MTIYRIYQENGHRAGFWVQHRKWSNTCARVVRIAGREAGRLPGAPPRHAGAAVEMLMFDIRSGRPLHEACGSDDGEAAAAAAAVRVTAKAAADVDDAAPVHRPDAPPLDPA